MSKHATTQIETCLEEELLESCDGAEKGEAPVSAQVNSINFDIGPAMGFSDIRSKELESDQEKQGMVNMDPDGIRAQFDTGAFVSCTNLKEMITESLVRRTQAR